MKIKQIKKISQTRSTPPFPTIKPVFQTCQVINLKVVLHTLHLELQISQTRLKQSIRFIQQCIDAICNQLNNILFRNAIGYIFSRLDQYKSSTKTGKTHSFSETLTLLHELVYYIYRHESVRSRDGLLVLLYI